MTNAQFDKLVEMLTNVQALLSMQIWFVIVGVLAFGIYLISKAIKKSVDKRKLGGK